MKKPKIYLWIGVIALTGCAQKPTTNAADKAQEEYDRVRSYCSGSSNPVGMQAVKPNYDPQALPEFETDVVGYDDCMQRYWPEHQQ